MIKVLFPCKCDPIHVGHLIQIKKLLKRGYDVTVDILDKDRVQSIDAVRYILRTMFDDKVQVKTHSISYQKRLPESIEFYDYVVTGNSKIIRVLIDNVISFILIKRYPGYRASKMKEMYKND